MAVDHSSDSHRLSCHRILWGPRGFDDESGAFGFEEVAGDAVAEVLNSEGGAPELLEAAVNRLGLAVARTGLSKNASQSEERGA